LWQAIKIASKHLYAWLHVANAVDMRVNSTGGFEAQDELRQIHVTLFIRTIEISFIVTVACLLLGYPVAYLMANLPLRTSNLLLILVLMPFWTSLLVRTTAWIAMLQRQGVMNDLFVAFGLAK
jgi:putative spermidine/putrescine transport system permease protein